MLSVRYVLSFYMPKDLILDRYRLENITASFVTNIARMVKLKTDGSNIYIYIYIYIACGGRVVG
jgi:hypothetical protein